MWYPKIRNSSSPIGNGLNQGYPHNTLSGCYSRWGNAVPGRWRRAPRHLTKRRGRRALKTEIRVWTTCSILSQDGIKKLRAAASSQRLGKSLHTLQVQLEFSNYFFKKPTGNTWKMGLWTIFVFFTHLCNVLNLINIIFRTQKVWYICVC